MPIAAHEPRCADALDKGCPDRKQCARWKDAVARDRDDLPINLDREIAPAICENFARANAML
jgi:hypothetical protein